MKAENEPLDNREYRRLRHRNRQPRPLRSPPPPPPPQPAAAAAAAQPPAAPNAPSSNISSMFNFSPFSPISAPSAHSGRIELDTLLDTLLEDGEFPYLPPDTPPPMQPRTPPFQILPLNSNDPPPVTAVEAVQQKKITSAEKSAHELETILSVAGSSIRSVINELQSPISSSTAPPIDQHPDDRWNELNQMFQTMQDEMNADHHNDHGSSSSIATENLYDDLLDHNSSPLPTRKSRRPTAPLPTPRNTGYIPYKQMPVSPQMYIPHKKMPTTPQSSSHNVGTSPIPPPQSHSVASSPIPQPRRHDYGTQMTPQQRQQKEYGTQMDHDIRTHNKIPSIYEDFCKGKTSTRHTTHRIMDIVHQVAKDNIR